jgi:hypothetical protein
MTLPTVVIRPEVVDVNSRGSVALTDNFDCRDIKRSSIIQRVCYQETQRYLIINIQGVYHQYCDVPVSTYLEQIPFRFKHSPHGERNSCILLPGNRQLPAYATPANAASALVPPEIESMPIDSRIGWP